MYYGDDMWIDEIRVPAPNAGLNASFRIPGETWLSVDVVRCTLVADANVANRFVSVDYLDGDLNIVARTQSTGAVVAGATFSFTFAARCAQILNGGLNEQFFGISDAILMPDYTIRVAVGNIQVGDQLSGIRIYGRRFPSSKWAPSPGSRPYES